MDICPECKQGQLVWMRIEEHPSGGWWQCNDCQEQFRKLGPKRYVKLTD